ncbi:MAG: ABC transporter ATP-binding protein [Hyphomonas sp.]|nr:ABC transporter ATP-binding protein [Hyphomonas sp.]
MSSDELAIRAEGISKRYALFRSPADRIRQAGSVRFRRMLGLKQPARDNEFLALDNVSFEIPRGHTVGIVGRNGSGKSTLLQIVCGTLPQTAGNIEVNGRVAALLELGSGFNPEYSGRDNVFLNSAILGATEAETRARMDQILDFADIGRFIDQPVKTYSSGMYVRLAFATAINVDPDILVIDEALAVGDEAFQRKCFARLRQIQENGATILFVSHSAQSVISLCDRAILIDQGQKLMDGEPKEVTAQYQRLVHAPRTESAAIRESILNGDWRDKKPAPSEPKAKAAPAQAPPAKSEDADLRFETFDPNMKPSSTVSYEPNGCEISGVHITNANGKRCNTLVHDHVYRINYQVRFTRDCEDVSFATMLKTIVGVEVFGYWSHPAGAGPSFSAGDTVNVSLPFVNRLLPGTYFANVGVFSYAYGQFSQLHRIMDVVMFKVARFDSAQQIRGVANLLPGGDKDRISEGAVVERLAQAAEVPVAALPATDMPPGQRATES